MTVLELQIGGQLRLLNFSQGMRTLFRHKVKDLPDEEQVAFAPHWLLWAALKANCVAKGLPVDFTFEQVFEWYEGLDAETILKITTAYVEADPTPEVKEGEKELTDEEKKSSTTIIEDIVINTPAE